MENEKQYEYFKRKRRKSRLHNPHTMFYRREVGSMQYEYSKKLNGIREWVSSYDMIKKRRPKLTPISYEDLMLEML